MKIKIGAKVGTEGRILAIVVVVLTWWVATAPAEEIHDAAGAGDVEKVKMLLDINPELVNAKNDYGQTPLHKALNKEVAEIILAHRADINAKDKNGLTSLSFKINSYNHDVVRVLLQHGAKDEIEGTTSPPREIHETATLGDLSKIKELLEGNPGLANSKDRNESTALHWANDKDMADLLIAHKAEVNARDKNGLTPLHTAAQNGHRDVVELLLSKGAEINAKNKWESTPLHTATQNGHKDVVELLLARGAEANAKGKYGETPLFSARNKDVAELLLNKGAEVNAKNSWESTPLHDAHSRDVAEFLLSRGAEINAKDNYDQTPLFSARNKDIAELLLTRGCEANAKGKYGDTPLHKAANDGRKDVVELLLARGTDINAKDKYMSTPLHSAANNSRTDVVELLLARGAEANAKNDSEQTPLFSAGNKDIAELLLARGCEANAKGKYGDTPLFKARDKDVAELFLARGCEVNTKNQNLDTPLHEAARNGRKDVVELLLARGADVNAKNKDGYTPLHRAAYYSYKDIVVLLLSGGADVNVKDMHEKTPLFNVSNKDVAELLIAQGADVNARDKYGGTPLHSAAASGHKDIVELLLANKADINAKNNDNETPLHRVAGTNYTEVVDVLLANKSEINTKDNKGHTPLHLAANRGNKDIVKALLANKADVTARTNYGWTALGIARNNIEVSEVLRHAAKKEILKVGTSVPNLSGTVFYTSKWGDYGTFVPEGWKVSYDSEGKHFTDTYFKSSEPYYSMSIQWYARYKTHSLPDGTLEMFSGVDDYIKMKLSPPYMVDHGRSELTEAVHDVELGELGGKRFVVRLQEKISSVYTHFLGAIVSDEVTREPGEHAYTVVPTEGGFYVLKYFAPKGGYDKYKKFYDYMVSSFEPDDGPGTEEKPGEILERYMARIKSEKEGSSFNKSRTWELDGMKGTWGWKTSSGLFDNIDTRRAVVNFVSNMETPPAIPEEAKACFMKAVTFFKAAKDNSDYKYAIEAFNEALCLAPWWGNAYYNMGMALEAAGCYDDAIESVNLYILTKPGEPDASRAEEKIYEIHAKQELENEKTTELYELIRTASVVYDEGKYAQALEMLRKVAEEGQLDEPATISAFRSLGFMYREGKGVIKDYVEAAKWFRKAAEQGDAPSEVELGNAYRMGHGVTQDYEEGMKWFQRALEHTKDENAVRVIQYNLGVCYENGEGVQQNMNKAVELYRQAAQKGHEASQKRLRELGKKW